jgi:hypothetical protein
MASEKQIAANRRNAQLSTGPKTEEGKAVSSRNALKHGFRSHYFLQPYQGTEHYDSLLADLFAEHQPQTVTEQAYVERIAIAMFRLVMIERSVAIQVGYNSSMKTMQPYWEQIEKLERSVDRSVNQLRKLQKDRRIEAKQQVPAPEPEASKAAKRPPQREPEPHSIPQSPSRQVEKHADPPPNRLKKAS